MSAPKRRVWLIVGAGAAAICLLVGGGLFAVLVVAALLLRSESDSAATSQTAFAPAEAPSNHLPADDVPLPEPVERTLPASHAPPDAGASNTDSEPAAPADPMPKATPPVPADTEVKPAAEATAPFASMAPLAELLPGVSLEASATLRSTLTASGPARTLGFSPDGGMLAVADGNKVELWDAATGKPSGALDGHTDLVTGIDFSRDSARIAAASHDTSVGVWDSKAARGLARLEGHSKAAHVVAFFPAGNALASGGFDGVVHVWNVAEKRAEKTLTHGSTEVTALACSPDGALLASGGRDGTLVFWNASTAAQLASQKAHISAVNQIAFLPGGRFLISAGADQTTKFWSTRAPFEAVAELGGHRGGVSSVAVHPSGRLLATAGGSDGRIMFWDAMLGDALGSFSAHAGGIRGIAFSPSGAILASCAGDLSVKLWDVTLLARELPPSPRTLDVYESANLSQEVVEEVPGGLEVGDPRGDDPLEGDFLRIGPHAAARRTPRLFRDGVGVWRFARSTKQKRFGGMFLNAPPGKPTGGPKVVRSLSPWQFDPADNAVAKCYVTIPESGEYDFLLDSFFRRSEIYINGTRYTYSPTDDFPAPPEPASGVIRVELAEGRAALVLVGYWGSQGEVGLLWRLPGEKEFQPIPKHALHWLPNT